MTEGQIIVGLLAILIIVVGVVAAEVYRLNDTLAPVLNSTLVRTATGF